MTNNIPTATVPDLKSKTPYEIYEPLKIPNLPMPTTAEVKRAKNKMQLFALFFRAWCAYKHKYKNKVVLHHSFYRIRSDGRIDPFDTVTGTRTVEIAPAEMPPIFDTWPKIKIHGGKKK
tara:strand:+ start:249 stop:605 length:357 start_codon:yes stop_codon:yes gene_type:complete